MNSEDAQCHKFRLSAILIVAGVLVVFGQTIRHDYVLWDDDALLLSNPAVMTPSLDALKLAWQGPYEHLYVPLTYNLWFLIARVARLLTQDAVPGAGWFHAASIIVHAGNALLVYALLRSLKVLWPAATIGAFAFALHPIQVEAVAWCSAMKDLLSTCLALLCMVCHIRAMDAASSSTRRTAVLHLVALLSMALATLAKPGVVAVPAMLVAIDLLILGKTAMRTLLWNLPLLVVGGAAVVWTQAVQSVEAFSPLPILLRPAVAVDALAFYLQKLALPIRLCTDYGRDPHTVWSSGRWIWAWLIPVCLFGLILPFARRHKMLAAGLMLFCIGLLPVLGIVPFAFQYYSTVADRYAYLPMIGFALMVADLAMLLKSRPQWILAGGILIAWAALSTTQARIWRNGEALELHTITVNPRSAAAYTRLACQAAEIPASDHSPPGDRHLPQVPPGSMDVAREYCWKSLFIRNDYAPAMNNLITLDLLEGRLREALTLAECFGRMAAIHHLPKGNFSFSAVWVAEGWLRLGEPAKARKQLNLALQSPEQCNQANRLLRQMLQDLQTR